MHKKLRAQLDGIEHSSALLRRQAVVGVFALLKAHRQQGDFQEVLLACLGSPHPVRTEGYISSYPPSNVPPATFVDDVILSSCTAKSGAVMGTGTWGAA